MLRQTSIQEEPAEYISSPITKAPLQRELTPSPKFDKDKFTLQVNLFVKFYVHIF